MKKVFFFINLIIINFSLLNVSEANFENKIVAKIDNKIITSYEIKNKIVRTLIISNSDITQDNINSIKPQALDSLINYKLKQIQLQNFNYKINQQNLNSYINRISDNNVEKLKKKFNEYKIDYNLFVKEVETELKWQQFIFNTYSKKIQIDESSLDEEIKEMTDSKINIREVNLSEIKVFQDAKRTNEIIISNIVSEINDNGFENTASKFSISLSSSQKGNLGWINTKSLSKKINNVVSKMKPGEISSPIIQTDTILFLKINSERTISNNEIDNKKLKETLYKQKQNEMFNLYSKSHLSRLKNNHFIQYK